MCVTVCLSGGRGVCDCVVFLEAVVCVTVCLSGSGLMEELAWQLPFPREVISQMDAKTTLCLALCYFR